MFLLAMCLVQIIWIKKKNNVGSLAKNLEPNSYNDKIEKQRQMLLDCNADLQLTLAILKKTQTQLAKSQKMASLGSLVVSVTHEINNPINFIQSGSREMKKRLLLLDSLVSENHSYEANKLISEMKNLLISVENGARRSSKIIKNLSLFSHIGVDEMKPVLINALIGETLGLLKEDFVKVTVTCNYGEIPPICGMRDKLIQVFINVFANAVQAMNGEGELKITTLIDSKNRVKIAVCDTGPGINPEILPKIFDPFFTTKPIGKGTGLGLAICHQIIEQHEGEITCQNLPEYGVCVTIILPIEQTKPEYYE